MCLTDGKEILEGERPRSGEISKTTLFCCISCTSRHYFTYVMCKNLGAKLAPKPEFLGAKLKFLGAMALIWPKKSLVECVTPPLESSK